MTDLPDTPEWLALALASPGESRFVDVEGCRIHYLRWGDPRRPGLLLVPASGAHAHWFGAIAPLLADQFCVAAIDPSGCGDSGRRSRYSAELVTAEIMAVFGDAGMLAGTTPPVLVGHSAGAVWAMRTALAHGSALLGVIALDGLRYAELAKDHAIKIFSQPRPEPKPAAPPRVHLDFAAAMARFRLTPEPRVPVARNAIVEHIARHSLRAVEGGWVWKYDPAQGAAITLGLELKHHLRELRCRAAAIYCEHSHLADNTAADVIASLSDGRMPVLTIPGASHYPMIDSPLALVMAVKAIALSWIAEATANRAPVS